MDRGTWKTYNYEKQPNSRSRNFKFRNNQQIPNKPHLQNSSKGYDRTVHHNPSRRYDRGYNNHFEHNNRNFRRNKPYERPHNRYVNRNQHKKETNNDIDIQIPICPLEAKINTIVTAVQGQGTIGQMVLVTNEKDSAASILQNAIQNIKDCCLNVVLNDVTNKFELSINGVVLGVTDGSKVKQIAKSELCEDVLEKLKKKCFYILKKVNFEEVSTGDQNNPEPQPANSSFEGSKAYSMMLKMGWGGKGLGVQEQGEQKTVAEKMVQNITKEGLGSKNFIAEINKLLNDYSSSTKVSTLAFDSSFSKEERAQIHKLAQKFNLKSKSLGKEPDRRITITKKMAKWDLVKELLRSDLENDSYKLTVPDNFHSLWFNEDETKTV